MMKLQKYQDFWLKKGPYQVLCSLTRTQRANDVNITSPQRRCNVMTLHRR